jgi:hypothetical protein
VSKESICVKQSTHEFKNHTCLLFLISDSGGARGPIFAEIRKEMLKILGLVVVLRLAVHLCTPLPALLDATPDITSPMYRWSRGPCMVVFFFVLWVFLVS